MKSVLHADLNFPSLKVDKWKYKSMLQARLCRTLTKICKVKRSYKSVVPVNVHEWQKPDWLYGLRPQESCPPLYHDEESPQVQLLYFANLYRKFSLLLHGGKKTK